MQPDSLPPPFTRMPGTHRHGSVFARRDVRLAHGEGGHLYFAYQLGIYSMLFRLLLALRPAFGRVRVTPTFAAHRTPLYVFLGEYSGAESPAAVAALTFLEALPTAKVL